MNGQNSLPNRAGIVIRRCAVVALELFGLSTCYAQSAASLKTTLAISNTTRQAEDDSARQATPAQDVPALTLQHVHVPGDLGDRDLNFAQVLILSGCERDGQQNRVPDDCKTAHQSPKPIQSCRDCKWLADS